MGSKGSPLTSGSSFTPWGEDRTKASLRWLRRYISTAKTNIKASRAPAPIKGLVMRGSATSSMRSQSVA